MNGCGILLPSVLALAAAGCTTAPVQPPPASPAMRSSLVEMTEDAYRQRATSLAESRRWADAATQWELLAVLRPESKEYRVEAETARRRAAETAAAYVHTAEEARKRGNNEGATQAYLRALSADPGSAVAANGLKAIEVERTRRAWLDRAPRVPYTPLDKPPSDAAADDPPARK